MCASPPFCSDSVWLLGHAQWRALEAAGRTSCLQHLLQLAAEKPLLRQRLRAPRCTPGPSPTSTTSRVRVRPGAQQHPLLTPLGATAPCTRLPHLHAGGGDRRHGGALCGRAVRLHGRLCHDLHSYRSVGRGAPLHRGKSPASQWRTSRRARVGCCVGRCVRWWRERADPYVLFHRAAQERGPAEKRTLFGLYVFSTGLIVRRPAPCRLCPLQR